MVKKNYKWNTATALYQLKTGVRQVLEEIKATFEENCAQACKKNKHKSQNK